MRLLASRDGLLWLAGLHRIVTRPVLRLTQTGRFRRLVDAEAPPVAAIDLSAGCSELGCWHFQTQCARWLGKANSPESWRNPLARAWRPTTILIDLREWDGYAGWLAAVKKETDGNMGREVRKAQRLGYVVRPIVEAALGGSIAAIRRSKKMRAHGFVSDIVTGETTPDAEDGASRQPERPPCGKHWLRSWGVFRREGERDRLLAYSSTVRMGNLLQLTYFMGHGAALRDGVTKLLMFELVAWLYAGGEGLAEGIEYVRYGNVEHAGPGLMEWLRDFKFRVGLLQIKRPPTLDSMMPPGFSPRRYLALNPDVAAAGMEPRLHWLMHGASEKRRYS